MSEATAGGDLFAISVSRWRNTLVVAAETIERRCSTSLV
jgi:hypothetical protein